MMKNLKTVNLKVLSSAVNNKNNIEFIRIFVNKDFSIVCLFYSYVY